MKNQKKLYLFYSIMGGYTRDWFSIKHTGMAETYQRLKKDRDLTKRNYKACLAPFIYGFALIICAVCIYKLTT